MRRILEARIDALPDAYREVFVLRSLEDLPVEETAAALGISKASVRARYLRAHGLLRQALARDIDLGLQDAFGFASERIVSNVLNSIKAGT